MLYLPLKKAVIVIADTKCTVNVTLVGIEPVEGIAGEEIICL